MSGGICGPSISSPFGPCGRSLNDFADEEGPLRENRIRALLDRLANRGNYPLQRFVVLSAAYPSCYIPDFLVGQNSYFIGKVLAKSVANAFGLDKETAWCQLEIY
jgi:hypothetical protein